MLYYRQRTQKKRVSCNGIGDILKKQISKLSISGLIKLIKIQVEGKSNGNGVSSQILEMDTNNVRKNRNS